MPSIALPEPDPTMARLDEAARRFAGETNLRRAGLELQGAAAFTAVTQALIDLRAPTPIVDLCASAIGEEIDHSDIYVATARAYLQRDVPPPRPSPIDVPRYPSVGDDGERLLQVVGMCCINETMACAFLEHCFTRAVAPLAREGVRRILADEVRHARVGWAYLGSGDVGPAERRLVSTWLLPVLRAQWHHWKEHIVRLPDVDLAEHGCPRTAGILAASAASIDDLVLPGFERAGIDAAGARRWAAGGVVA